MNRSSRQLVTWLFAAGILYSLFLFRAIVLPFVLAATLAYLLLPLVALLEIRGFRHSVATLTVFLGFAVTLGVLVYGAVAVVSMQAVRAAKDWPLYINHFQIAFDRMQGLLSRIPGVQTWMNDMDLKETLSSHGRSWVISLLQHTPSIANHLLPVVEYIFLIPFLTYLFLSDGDTFRNRLIQWVPARHVEMVINLLVEMDTSLGNYLRGMCLQAVFMGLLAGIGYKLMGLHYAVHIGVWVALTSAVPFIGPISAALAGAMVALFQWGTLTGLVKVVAVYMGIRFIDDWFLHPMILRKAVHLHPLMTVFALMAGAHTAGFWGLLFAVPVVCILKVALEVGWLWYWSERGQPSSLHIQASRVPLV